MQFFIKRLQETLISGFFRIWHFNPWWKDEPIFHDHTTDYTVPFSQLQNGKEEDGVPVLTGGLIALIVAVCCIITILLCGWITINVCKRKHKVRMETPMVYLTDVTGGCGGGHREEQAIGGRLKGEGFYCLSTIWEWYCNSEHPRALD